MTVLLAAVVAPTIFASLSGATVETPDAEFNFVYEEHGSSPTGTDRFGTQFASTTGIVTIQFERGEPLSLDRLAVRSDTSGGRLETGTDSTASQLTEGETIQVAVNRGDTVRLQWTHKSGESSLLASFTATAPSPAGPSWLPDPTSPVEAGENCSYIRQQLPNDSDSDIDGTDIEISGVVVKCNLSQFYPQISDISIYSVDGDLGAIIGETNGTGDIQLDDGGVFSGDIKSGRADNNGDVDIKSGSQVYGSIIAKGGDGSIDIDGQSSVTGALNASGDVDVDTQSAVRGEILSGTGGDNGDVTISTQSTVGGPITARGEGSVDVDGNSTIGGAVSANNQVDLENTRVDGSVQAGRGGDSGDIQITSQSVVAGNVTATPPGNGSIDIDGKSTVQGHVSAAASVSVDAANVTGGIRSGTSGGDGDIDVSSDSFIGGPITADTQAAVDVDGGSTVDGPVQTDGQVSLNRTDVRGNVTTDADIDVDGTTISGTVTGANIDLSNSHVTGHVIPQGSFSCNNSTINGRPCDAYNNPRLDISITGTNSPVTNGTLTLTATVTNRGFAGQTTLNLTVGPRTETAQLTLTRGETRTGLTLSVDTTPLEGGVKTATLRDGLGFGTATTDITIQPEAPLFTVTTVTSPQTALVDNPLPVTARITNTGTKTGTPTVTLTEFTGLTVNETQLPPLSPGTTRTTTLSWTPGQPDTGTGTLAITTANDTGTTTTSVVAPQYDLSGVTLTAAKGNRISATVGVDTTDPQATIKIVALRRGSPVDSTRTQISESGTTSASLKGANQADSVRVLLLDADGTTQDVLTKDWFN